MWYIYLFLLFCFGSYMIAEPAHCSIYNNNLVLTNDQMEEYIDLVEFHRDKAETYMMCLETEIWSLPECSDKEKAKYFFTSFMATFSVSGLSTKVMAAALTFFAQYGLECIDHWHRVQYHLIKAKYHYEMMEFFQEVLMKG